MKPFILIATLFAIAMLPLDAFAQAPKKVADVEGITEYRLDNGCRVLLFPDKSSSSITVNVTLFVGSRHEGYKQQVGQHVLERETDRHHVLEGPRSAGIIEERLGH